MRCSLRAHCALLRATKRLALHGCEVQAPRYFLKAEQRAHKSNSSSSVIDRARLPTAKQETQSSPESGADIETARHLESRVNPTFSEDVVQVSASGNSQRRWRVATDTAVPVITPVPSQQFQSILRASLRFFLPAGYPRSVSPGYLSYAGWTALGAIASSAGGVLSMHALLLAVGVGSGAAAPLAAAANWVLKDGLGQLGGVAFAAFVNTRFDADPKRWRWLSAAALDAATLVELCTPLAPGAFLPLAALANVGKNVAWLSASATRAGVHQALALHGNLADVTAKAGSQSIAASTLGMGLGVVLAPLAAGAAAGPLAALPLFAALSATHLFCVHRGLRSVQLRSLGGLRLRIACRPILAQLREECLAELRGSHPQQPGLAASPSELGSEIQPLNVGAVQVLSPAAVATLEPILQWPTAAPAWMGGNMDAPVAERILITTGTAIERLPGFAAAWHRTSWKRHPTSQATAVAACAPSEDYQRHIIVIEWQRGLPAAVHVLYSMDACPKGVLSGYLHAALTAELLASWHSLGALGPSCHEEAVIVDSAGVVMRRSFSKVAEALLREGWSLEAPVLTSEIGGRIVTPCD